jgi:hypothetical protein
MTRRGLRPSPLFLCLAQQLCEEGPPLYTQGMTDIVVLRDLPGVAELERGLNVPGRQLDPEWDDLDDRIHALGIRLFGISEDDTYYRPSGEPDAMGQLHWAPADHQAWDEWEKHFAFLDEDEIDEEQDEAFWQAVGWNVTDEDGFWLSILDYWGRQIVCIAKRLHPRARLSLTGNDPFVPPTLEEARRDAEAWGANLAEEARRFKPHRPD